MSFSPRSLSPTYEGSKTNFYTTTLHPMSYYSPRRNLQQICPKINNTYTSNFYPEYIDKNVQNNNLEKSIDNINDYKTYNNRERASPFYRDEKSIRLQEEIDWMNAVVAGKSKIHKMHGSNSFCELINNSRNDMNGSSCYLAKGGQLNDFKNRIKRKKYKKFNDSIDSYLSYNKAPDPLIITPKYIKSGTFTKNNLDKYNYNLFMKQMINFRNNGIYRWRKEFNKKFNQY
jgi:hypothetical protein